MELQNVEKQVETTEHLNVEENLETIDVYSDTMQEHVDILQEQNNQDDLDSMKLQNIVTEQQNSIIERQNAQQYLEYVKLQNILMEEGNVRENLIAMEMVNRIMEKHNGEGNSETMEQQQNDQGYLTTTLEPEQQQQNLHMDEQNGKCHVLTMEQLNVEEHFLTIDEQLAPPHCVAEQFLIPDLQNFQKEIATLEEQGFQEYLDGMTVQNILMEMKIVLMEDQNILGEHQNGLELIDMLQKGFMEVENIIIKHQNGSEDLEITMQNILMEENSVAEEFATEEQQQQNVTEQFATEEQQKNVAEESAPKQEHWEIQKDLQRHDLKQWLLIPEKNGRKFLSPVMKAVSADAIEKGIDVSIWDVDTNTSHNLVLTKNSRSHVLTANWVHDFVKRRDLRFNDVVGLHWDASKERFNFSVLSRGSARQ